MGYKYCYKCQAKKPDKHICHRDGDLKRLDAFVFEAFDNQNYSNMELVDKILDWSKDRPNFETGYLEYLKNKGEQKMNNKDRISLIKIITKFKIKL